MSWTSNVRRQVLPNGLTVLVERNASAPVVAAVTHVKAGYFDEPDEWVGIAHVLEHMYFKGTSSRPPGEIARETQLLGGYLNAGTIYDKTVYYTVLPAAAHALDRAVELQADALMHSALDAGELARELEVIIQEAMRKLDNPHAVAGETLYELLFNQHRMRRWRIGTGAELRRITADDLRQYYETRYTPDRTIVGLVGDLDVEHAFDLAARTFERWVAGPAHTDSSPAESDPPPPRLRVIRGDVERPLAVMGWRTMGTLHSDVPALDVAASLLGSGRGSWLSRAVRIPGLASSARAYHYTPTEVGVFDLVLESSPERMDDAVGRTLELMARLVDPGPDAADVDRVRSLTAVQWSRRLETMDNRGALFCEFEALGGYELADEFYRKAQSATVEDVIAVVGSYLDPGAVAGVLYLPRDGATRFEASPWPPVLNGGPEPQPVRARKKKKKELPYTGAAPRRFPGKVSHVALPGGDLLIRPKRGVGLVFVGAYAVGLRELETKETAGVSALLTRSAVRGAGGMSAEELAIRAETLGGTVSPVATIDAIGWGLTVRPDVLAEAADLLFTIASDSTLAGADLAVERSLQASDAARVHDDMVRYPIRRVLEQAFPKSAYGLPTLGEPDGVVTLGDDLIRDWAGKFRESRILVVAVGDLESDSLLEGLAPFGNWPKVPAHEGRRDGKLELVPGRGQESRQKAQSALAMAFPSGPYSSEYRFPSIVLSSLLSGLAGRLFEALREQRSLAYTVAAIPWLKRRAGTMLTYVATSPEREEEARQGMLDELAKVAADALDDSELDRARNYAAGAVQLRQQGSHTVAGEVIDAWIHGDLKTLTNEAERLREVTREELQSVAARIFRADARAEYTVHGTGVGR